MLKEDASPTIETAQPSPDNGALLDTVVAQSSQGLTTSEPVVSLAPPARKDLDVVVDGRRVIVTAHEELELRCGDAAIILCADGRIELRGTYITSHASATQRIVGGSVAVN